MVRLLLDSISAYERKGVTLYDAIAFTTYWRNSRGGLDRVLRVQALSL